MIGGTCTSNQTLLLQLSIPVTRGGSLAVRVHELCQAYTLQEAVHHSSRCPDLVANATVEMHDVFRKWRWVQREGLQASLSVGDTMLLNTIVHFDE